MGAEVAALAAVGGLTSMIGSSMNRDATLQTNNANIANQAKLNAMSMKFQHDESEIARQWQEKEWEHQFVRQNGQWFNQQEYLNNIWQKQFDYSTAAQQNWENPSTQAQMWKNAGMNPALMMGDIGSVSPFAGLQSSPVSSPQVTTPHAGAPNLHMAHQVAPMLDLSMATSFSEIAKNLSSSKLDDANAYRSSALVHEELNSLLLKNKSQELANSLDEIGLEVAKYSKDSKIAKAYEDYLLTIQQRVTLGKQGSLYDEQVLTEKSQQLLNMMTSKCKSVEEQQKLLDLSFNIASFNDRLESFKVQNAVGRSQVSANVARAEESYAVAGWNRAQSQTENEMRASRVELGKIQSRIASNSADISDATKQAEIDRALAILTKEKDLLPQQMEEDLRKAKHDNDWATVHEILNVANTALDAYTGVMGVRAWNKIGSAQESRAMMNERYKEYQMTPTEDVVIVDEAPLYHSNNQPATGSYNHKVTRKHRNRR